MRLCGITPGWTQRVNNAAASVQWGIDSALDIAAALLLAATFLGSVIAAWRRLGADSRARWAGVAVLNATSCLAIFALLSPPVLLQPASDAVTLVTEGATSPPEAIASAYVAPDAGDFGNGPGYLLDAGQLPLREPALGALTVAGHGLEASQWQALPENLAIRFEPPPLSGLIAAAWPRMLLQGEPLLVTGRYLEDPLAKATSIELLDPAGVAVAAHDLLAGDAFELITYPKAPGLLDYRLRVLGVDGELRAEPVPVFVRPGDRPVLYVLQSAPSFETRQLRNWAGDNGATVVSDTVITRGRELRQLVNADQLADDRLSPALLEITGLAMVDGRAWAGLGADRRTWFEAAVRQGMGLLILADGDLADYLDDNDGLLQGFGLAEQERDPDGYVPIWEGPASEQRLPVLGFELVHQDGAAFTRIESGEVVEAYRNVGLGRIAISVLRERHRWLTAGNEATYTAYWTRLMGRLGRPGPLPYLMPPAEDDWSRPHRRTRLCAMAGDIDVSFEIASLQGGAAIEIKGAAPGVGGPRRCAEFWPQQTGWHRARLYAGDSSEWSSEAWYYVFAEDQWQAHWRYSRQQATLKRASAIPADEAPMTRTARVAIDPLWPWLIFMVSAGLLWLERRLDD
jgi:hypothetical protein